MELTTYRIAGNFVGSNFPLRIFNICTAQLGYRYSDVEPIVPEKVRSFIFG